MKLQYDLCEKLTVGTVVPEPDVVADGVGEVGGQDVRLEDVHVDADPHGLPRADRPHRGYGRPAIFKALAPNQSSH